MPKFIIKNCVSGTQRTEECVCNKFLGEILDFTELGAIRNKALAAYDEQDNALDISTLFSKDATIVLKKARFHGAIIVKIGNPEPGK